MRKTILIIFTAFLALIAAGQEKTIRLPFILLVDNDVLDPSVINGFFLIKDSVGVIKDSIKFDYQIGGLDMNPSDYNKFFHIKRTNKIYVKFEQKDLKLDTTIVYLTQIPNNYINGEYPNGFINKRYFIVKIFNKSNVDSSSRYYFKKDENYIVQIIIPGFATLLPFVKKE